MRKYLVGVIALFALTLTSLGLAAGSPSSVGTGPSGAASPGTSTASGRCSKAAATAVVRRLHLGNADSMPNPVFQVLCGAFVGPGSEAMVASLSIPSCGRTAGWVVFRWAGGAWQLVRTRNNGAVLAAVGPDIQETMFVLRPTDKHCFPTGGTRSRTWHWNGTRFTVSAWKLTPAKLHLDNFLSPDRKVWCGIYPPDMEDEATCVTMTNPVHSGAVRRNGEVTVCNGCQARVGDRGAPVLRYGEQTELYVFRCTSETKGITCTLIRSGKGFLINRTGVSRVGP